jgi:hypothetical protein
MKKILFLVVLLYSIQGWSQDKQSLEASSNQMYEHMVSGNYEALYDDMNPGMIKGVKKEEAIAGMKMMENEDFKIQILKIPSNFIFGEIKKVNDSYYSLIEHDLATKLTFKETIKPEEREMFENMFKSMFGASKSEFLDKENAFVLYSRTTMVAIADKSSNYKWTFGLPNDEINKIFGL